MTDAETGGTGGGGKGLAVAALVLGITAFFPGCCLAGFYGNWVLAILAIIFGVMGMKGAGSGMAKAGLTLGIVSIALNVVLMVVGYELGTNLEEWIKEQESMQKSGDGGNFDGDFDGGSDDGDNDGGSDDGQSSGGASAPAANDSTDG